LVGGFERKANKGVRLLKTLIDVRPVFGMADVDVSDQAFGNELKLMAQSFHQHAAVSLDLFDPLIYFIESAINPFESPVNLLEALVDLLEALVDLLEALVDLLEPLVNLFKSPIDPFKSPI